MTSAEELASLVQAAKSLGYGVTRLKLSDGAELVLVPIGDPPTAQREPKKDGESDEAYAARLKQKAERDAHVARLAREMGWTRAEAFVDACLRSGGPVP